MDAREQSLLNQISDHGVTTQITCRLPAPWRAAYSKTRGEVYLREGLTLAQRISALAHELIHIRRGDGGHKDKATEECVQRRAALLLVSPLEYQLAEMLYDGNTLAIARELDVTPDIIRAYRQVLNNNY